MNPDAAPSAATWERPTLLARPGARRALDAAGEGGGVAPASCYSGGVSEPNRAGGARGPSPYVPVSPLARGGMGSVELVLRREGEFRRLYARKRPHAHHERAGTFRQHFLREARVAGLLRHPNVVSVLDVGEDPDGPYLVMDFVEGISLAQLIGSFRAQEDLLPLQVCLTIARQAADGLHAAHELRDHDGSAVALVHRDISPQNILIDFEGIARVTDFGLAKALGATHSDSSSDALKGKVGYMSPEQLRFEPLDRRSDLWALGVVLYEMLSCERLHGGPSSGGIEKVARQILDEPPPDIGEVRDDAPPALTELLWDLLAKDRADRPATASEVAKRLGEILREVERDQGAIELSEFIDEHFADERETMRRRRAVAIADAETSPQVELPPPPRRARWAIALGIAAVAAVLAVVLALGVGGAGWALWPSPDVATAASPSPGVEPTASPSPRELVATGVPAGTNERLALPSEGAPSEGAPSEGAPSEGAPSEGAPSEGAPNQAAADEAVSNGSVTSDDVAGDSSGAAPREGRAAPTPASGRRRGRRGAGPRDRLWGWP